MSKFSLSIFAIAVLATTAFAGPLVCPPTLSPDGLTVDPACPGLGAQVIAAPNSQWLVFFEDQNGGGDHDFNDLAFGVTFDATGIHGVATFLGGSTSGNDTALVYGLIPMFSDFAHPSPFNFLSVPNLPVIFGELVPDPNAPHGHIEYLTGPAAFNPDYQIHAWVGQTPEPNTIMLGVIGAALLIARRIRLR